MRTELHRVQSDCYKLILCTEGKKEETLELVVPDRCGDIGKILDVRGQLFLSTKKIRDGEAQICSRAELCVLFAAEGSGELEYVSAVLDFEQGFSLGEGRDDCEAAVSVRLCALDARALNPRKLLIRAECECALRCYAPDSFILWDGFEDDCTDKAYIQQRELSHSLITDIREKSFTISDEYSLPEKYAGCKMLSAETQLCVYDAKPVGGKLVFKANANTTGIFLNPEDDSVFKLDFITQFSQIIEIEAAQEAEILVNVCLKETEFVSLPDRDCPSFSMRLVMSAQALCQKTINSVYVSDAYSCEHDLTLGTAVTPYTLMSAAQKLRLPLKGRILLHSQTDCIVYLAPITVSCRADGSRLICAAELSGIAQGEGGELYPLKLSLSCEEQLALTDGEHLFLHSLCSESATLEPGGDVSIVLSAEYCVHEHGEVKAVCSIEYDESCSCVSDDCPALTVLISQRDEDIWTLAKKYRSTTELITAVNTVGESFDIKRRPLLIPRA